MVQNQCDGCRMGLPLENGIHVFINRTGYGRLYMVCEKERYLNPNEVVDEGYQAYLDGVEYDDCPYTSAELRNAWYRGRAMAKDIHGELTTC